MMPHSSIERSPSSPSEDYRRHMRSACGWDTVLEVSPGVSALPLGSELTVFDAAAGRSFALNRTAADAFELVDGRCTAEEITRTLSVRYGQTFEDIVDDVMTVLDGLAGSGTLRLVAPLS